MVSVVFVYKYYVYSKLVEREKTVGKTTHLILNVQDYYIYYIYIHTHWKSVTPIYKV